MFVTGCKNESAKDIVTSYLDEYKTLSPNIQKEIKNAVDNNDEFNSSNKKIYKDILKRQYKDLSYKIISEEYNDDLALIKVNIKVYDLNKAEEESLDYLSANLSEFYDGEIFNKEKYTTYKLSLMSKSKSKISYDILFALKKEKGTWVLNEPTESDLEKIHGLYKDDN